MASATYAPCFHCGLPSHPDFTAPLKGEPQAFCCIGCQAVAQAIVAGGLGDFYRLREGRNPQARTASPAFTAYDDPAVQEEFVVSVDGDIKEAHIQIGGITCTACVWLIEKHLLRLPGVIKVGVNSVNHRGFIRWHSAQLPLSKVFDALEQIGFVPVPQLAANQYEQWRQQQKTALLRLGVAGISMMQAGMVAVGLYAGAVQGLDEHWQNILRWITCLFALPVIFYSALPFYSAAWRALRMRQLTMDVSVSLALLLAFGASLYATITASGEVYFESLAMFTFILLAGRFLEQRARFRNFQHSASLQSLLPLAVMRIAADGGQTLVPLRSVRPGDQLKVGAGDIFPCDGKVLAGKSYAIEAILSGEAQPQPKQPGDSVLAGTHNGDTALVVQVVALGRFTQLAAIEHLFEQAASERPRQVALADYWSGYFVGAVLLVTLLTFLGWYWWQPDKALWVALSVLVVTCPCALSLATPAALVCGLGHLRQHGILVTAPGILETLVKVDQVVFDKTGTLTQGTPSLQEVRLLATVDRQQALEIIAALEASSSHPIARAFANLAGVQHASDVEVTAAAGVQGKVGGVVYRFGSAHFAWPRDPVPYPDTGQWLLLADDQAPLAWVLLQDVIRPSATPALAQLRHQGLGLSLLSGDRQANVEPFAREFAFDQARGEVSPQDKLAAVKSLQADRRVVMMVGDGINDVPVLGGADVSVAMGSASALTQTRADAVLLTSDLQQLPYALTFARKNNQIIRQNLLWALAYNAVALPAAVMGWIPPWLAAVGMSSSSLIVVFNAMRLNPKRSPHGAPG